MSNEFRPGHPLIFWLAMIVLAFAAFSGIKAGVTVDTCGDAEDKKGWIVFPPKWDCGGSGINLTAPD